MVILFQGLLTIVLSMVLTRGDSEHGDDQSMAYLSQYGYITSNTQPMEPIAEEMYTEAIQEFQGFAGINVTGELDYETQSMMTHPRCGMKDLEIPGSFYRNKRDVPQGSRSPVKDRTYKISKYPRALDKATTDTAVQEAFGLWSSVTPFSFTQKDSGSVDIDIQFTTDDPNIGPGRPLAHVNNSNVHFDDSQSWTINSDKGINLFQVAVHEFGHCLGLNHSMNLDAVMSPFYRGYDPSFKLDFDDIRAIQGLYGMKRRDSIGSGTNEDLFKNLPVDHLRDSGRLV